MSPVPLFPRDCVESLNHPSVRIVVATLFILTVRGDSIVLVMLHCDRLCCHCQLLIYFPGLAHFWIIVHLLFKGILRPSIVMAWQPATSFWFGKLNGCQSPFHGKFEPSLKAGRTLDYQLFGRLVQRIIDCLLLQPEVSQSFRREITSGLSPLFCKERDAFSMDRSPIVIAISRKTLATLASLPTFPAGNVSSSLRLLFVTATSSLPFTLGVTRYSLI